METPPEPSPAPQEEKEKPSIMFRFIRGLKVHGILGTRRKTTTLKHKFDRWRRRFSSSPPPQKLKMLLFPTAVVVIVSFILLYQPSLTTPQVVTTFPGDKGINIPLDSALEVQFNVSMNRPSVERAFLISPQVTGSFSWKGNTKVVFTPKEPLEGNQTYTVIINKWSLSSLLMPKLQKNSFSFTTISDHPTILLASPQTEAATDRPSITVMFDRPMIPLTTADEKKNQAPAFTIKPEVKGEGRWLGTTAYQFRPSSPLRPATTYTYLVKAGLKAEDGGTLQNDHHFSFTTPRPRLISTTPPRDSLYANPMASVSATISLPVDPQSAKESAHLSRLTNTQPEEVPLQIRVDNQEVGLYPLKPLERESRYEARLDEGLLSTAGDNGLETTQSWQFVVAPFPKVVASEPPDGTENAEEDHYLKVRFISPMDENSFKDNVFISPKPERKPSLYFSSYQGDNTLNIGTYLQRSTSYTVRISGQVRDQYGVPLGEDYQFSFTTAPFKPSISIVPPYTYFASFNQEVVPRIVTKVVNADRVNYKLFKLTREEFLHLFWLRHLSSNYQENDWQSYDPSSLELVRQWSETYEVEPNIPVHVITMVTKDNGEKIPSGLYFLETSIESGGHDNLVMVISQASLTLKTSPDQALVWAVDQNSGEVIPDMEVELVKVSGQQITQGKTNQEGVFMADVTIRPSSDRYSSSRDPLFAFAKKGDDSAVVVDVWDEGIGLYDFSLQSYWDPHESDTYQAKEQLKLHLQLDRPIYRPGQTVYYKGVVRRDDDGRYSLLDQAGEVSVVVEDARQKEVMTEKLPLTSYGTFSASFHLGEEGSVGYYTIRATILDNGFSQTFQVEEYRRPDFAVEVSTGRSHYVDGDAVKAEVEATYFFGAPLDYTPLTWTLTTQDYPYRWSKDRRFEFGDSDSYWYQPWWGFSYPYYSGETVGEGTGITDQNGLYQVTIPTNISDKSADQRLRLEAVVEESQSNQVIASSHEFTIHQGAIQVGLKPERYSTQAGEEARVEIVTLDNDGNEQGNTPVSLAFFKRTWQSVKEENPDDGHFYWVSKPSDELISATEVITGERGREMAVFTPPEGGTYRVVAEVSDSRGKKVRSTTILWVSGQGGQSQYRENHDRIVLVPDKQEYRIGEVANVFAALPYEEMTGLVTVERGSVFDYQVVKTTPDNQTISIPISERYSPNAFVSGLFIKTGSSVKDPPQFKMGIAEVRVDNPKQRVDLTFRPDKERYSPGETMKVSLETRDGNGTPVQTEVAAALVDQAVWSLARAELANIYETFYRPRNLLVLTSQVLTKLMDRINANVDLGSKGGSGGGCFTGETLILMSDGGYKPINQVAAGDNVLTRESENSSPLVPTRVNKVLVHDVDGYLVINQKLQVTGVHLVFSQQGWIAAHNLKVGDRLLNAHGTWITIKSIVPTSKQARVYNLETETYHTYLANNVWVHNQKGELETIREKFLDTAYWNAHLETNDQGKAEFSVELPDNLTTWRLIGVAVSKETAVGETFQEVLVTKDVLIQPLLPRFLSAGDEPLLGMTVHNTTPQTQAVQASIQTEGVKINNNLTQEITLYPNSSKSVSWKAVVDSVDEAVIEFRAQSAAKFSDAVKLTLPVVSYFTPEVVATSGIAADVATEDVFLPEDIVPHQGELTITLSPSLGVGVQDATNYLISYPYGCNEQTINRVLPLTYLLRLADKAGLESIGGYPKEQVRQAINDGLQHLTNAQRPDGGWGWWPNAQDSEPFISTLVMEGLLTARQDGFTVPEQTVNRGKDYLSGVLSSNQEPLEIQAYMAMVMVKLGSGDPGFLTRIMDRRWEMDTLGRAYLLRALQESGNSRRDQSRLIDELLSQVEKTNTTAHWEENTWNWRLMSGDVTLTSVILETLVHRDTNHPLLPEITRWLLQARYDNRWQSTRDTSAAVQALVYLMLARDEGKTDEKWTIDLDQNRVGQGSFTSSDLLRQAENLIPLAEIAKEEEVPIRIQKSGQGSLYYNVNLRYFLPFEEVEALDQGLVLIREFVDRNGNRLDDGIVSAGKELWIRLILVAPTVRHHVVIEDRLPAGLEPVNESLATTSLLNVERLEIPEDRQPLYFRHWEMRDDRVVLFAETVPPGVYEYTYRVRPTTPGRYHHPPAQAYNMYIPDISGHSSGGWLEVTAE